LPRLHAKVYSADGQRAIVTSGNLTAGGLESNHECGVLLTDHAAVREVEESIRAYARLGARVDGATLDAVCDVTDDIRSAYREQIASATRATTRRLAAVLGQAHDTLIRARLAGGPTHGVFARTIEHLLRRHGPLSTQAMHPMIQQLHPDLCDDTVDRVIDGKRFGRKWKHAVRTAQQNLKKRGLIAQQDDKWVWL
jgi:hypothetical protein